MTYENYTIVPQFPQYDAEADPPQTNSVRLVYDNLGETRAEQVANKVIVPDAEAWKSQQYELGDQVTASNGMIYQYVYPNRGNTLPDSLVRSLLDIAKEADLASGDTIDAKFYDYQNPALETAFDPDVPGTRFIADVTFWEVARSAARASFLDARPQVNTGRIGQTQVVIEVQELPDTIIFPELLVHSFHAQFQSTFEDGYLNPFSSTQTGSSAALQPKTQSNTFSRTLNRFFNNYDVIAGSRNLDGSPRFGQFTDFIIDDIDKSNAIQNANGNYYIAFSFFSNGQTSPQTGVSSIGQILCGNRRSFGYMSRDSSNQDLLDFSRRERGFDGALLVTPRFATFKARQTIFFDILETESLKRFMRDISGIPCAFYANRDFAKGTFTYGVMDNVSFGYRRGSENESMMILDYSGLV